MRLTFLLATLGAVFVPAPAVTAQEDDGPFDLVSETIEAGVPLAESAKGAYWIRLKLNVDKNGEGSGTLEIDPNAPVYDEFGLYMPGADLPRVKLECTLKLVKSKKYMLRSEARLGAPLVEVEFWLYQIQGPKITTRLALATRDKGLRESANLLVHDKDGKVKRTVHLTNPGPPPKCHPGCFPAGTPIRTPAGSQPIERLRDGDLVTTIGPDGVAGATKIASIFKTTNRLIEVQTDAGNLLTTETQPLALAAGGGLCAAGQLKAGDRVLRWVEGKRVPVAVRGLRTTGREEPVFNLILGDGVIFVADGFLVRSKPPEAVEPGRLEAIGPATPLRRE